MSTSAIAVLPVRRIRRRSSTPISGVRITKAITL
jgi:hypothetical protein